MPSLVFDSQTGVKITFEYTNEFKNSLQTVDILDEFSSLLQKSASHFNALVDADTLKLHVSKTEYTK